MSTPVKDRIASCAFSPDPREYGPGCRRLHEASILALAELQIHAAGMEEALRNSPEDDAAFEAHALSFQRHIPIASKFIDLFRATRDCHGGPH